MILKAVPLWISIEVALMAALFVAAVIYLVFFFPATGRLQQGVYAQIGRTLLSKPWIFVLALLFFVAGIPREILMLTRAKSDGALAGGLLFPFLDVGILIHIIQIRAANRKPG
jgi:hypothetical protein